MSGTKLKMMRRIVTGESPQIHMFECARIRRSLSVWATPTWTKLVEVRFTVPAMMISQTDDDQGAREKRPRASKH